MISFCKLIIKHVEMNYNEMSGKNMNAKYRFLLAFSFVTQMSFFSINLFSLLVGAVWPTVDFPDTHFSHTDCLPSNSASNYDNVLA